jgi:AraC family transcriptional regulator
MFRYPSPVAAPSQRRRDRWLRDHTRPLGVQLGHGTACHRLQAKERHVAVKWIESMNTAISYIEEHIGSRVDYHEAARIACCSLSRFQRMFVFVTDMPLAEYVRCRRMSLAASELLAAEVRVIDLALKYGYESPEAFTRAFRAFHGRSPREIRNGGTPRCYSRLVFQTEVMEDHVRMGQKPVVRIEDLSQRRVASFRVNCRGPEEAAWSMLREWVTTNTRDYEVRRYIGCAPGGHHPEGEEHQADERTGSHAYLAQMLLVGDEGTGGVFLGAEVCDAPTGLFIVGDVALNEFSADGTIDIGTSMEKSYGVMAECLAEMGGYAFELKERPYLEEHIFSTEWYGGGGELAGFKLWLPIRKAAASS